MIAAALSVVISAVFAAVMARRWAVRRQPYQAAWAIGLAMFAVAAAAGLANQLAGVSEVEYKTFYLFGAILNVAWLSLGTIHLLASRRVGRWATWVIIVFTVTAVVAVVISPINVAQAGSTGKGFDTAVLPRILAGIGSGVGSVILISGALWSAWVFVSKRHNGRSALANVLIAAGVLVAALGGTAAFTGTEDIVQWTNFVGVLLIFIGFLII